MKTVRLFSTGILSVTMMVLLGSFTFCVPQTSPAVRAIDENTATDSLNLSKYKGKVVILHFWASWSKSSRIENKNVARVHQKYKANPKVVFVSVSLDTENSNWKNAIEEDELKWPDHVCDFKKYDSPIALKYKVSTLPTMILVDTRGTIHSTSARMIDIENSIDGLLK